MLRESKTDTPPLSQAQAEEIVAKRKLTKEAQAFEKQRQALSKKWKAGTITPEEHAEMDRLFGADGDAMTNRLFTAAMKISKA